MNSVPKDDKQAGSFDAHAALITRFVPGQPSAVGELLSQDEVDLYKKARDAMWPIARIASYDDFAKWLFTIVAVIGTLGAAFSTSAFKIMTAAGAIMFGVAVLLTSVALSAAVLSRVSDFPANTNWMSSEMLTNASVLMRQKRALVFLAGVCFALALICASAAPMISVLTTQSHKGSLLLSSGKDGVHVMFSRPVNRGTVAELIISSVQGQNESMLSYQRAVSDDNGQLKVEGSTAALSPTISEVRISLTCDLANNERQDISLPIQQGAILGTGDALQKLVTTPGSCLAGSVKLQK